MTLLIGSLNAADALAEKPNILWPVADDPAHAVTLKTLREGRKIEKTFPETSK
jgi:hypothetical protein